MFEAGLSHFLTFSKNHLDKSNFLFFPFLFFLPLFGIFQNTFDNDIRTSDQRLHKGRKRTRKRLCRTKQRQILKKERKKVPYIREGWRNTRAEEDGGDKLHLQQVFFPSHPLWYTSPTLKLAHKCTHTKTQIPTALTLQCSCAFTDVFL